MALRGARFWVLVLLVLQTSVYTLLRRYFSMGPLRHKVAFPAILLATEVLKVVVSALLVEAPPSAAALGEAPKTDPPPAPPTSSTLLVALSLRYSAVRTALRWSLPMVVPAVAYAIMNMISYKALEYLDATVFVMLAQLKIVTAAVFSYPVLGRRQSPLQWRAILVLTLAVTTITYQRSANSGSRGIHLEVSPHFALGVLLTLVEISLSGWISAYFEKYLKDGRFSVWGRNLQLGFWSILIYCCVQAGRMATAPSATFNASSSGELVAQLTEGAVAGLRSPVVLLLILLGGGGGLLVAFALKYADAVLKSMATAFALVVVVVGEVLFMGTVLDPVTCLASASAVLGLLIYQDAPKVPLEAPNSEAAAGETKGFTADAVCDATDPEEQPLQPCEEEQAEKEEQDGC